MNMVMLRSEGAMSVDNIVVELDVAKWILDSRVELIAWNGDAATGFIEYNDRPRITEPLDDIAVYKDIVDVWIAAAAQLFAPLGLQQAKRVKQGLVDALYHAKRRKPFSYGGRLYDSRDEAVGYLAATVVSAEFVDPGAFGTMISTLNHNVAISNHSRDRVNSWSATMAQNWNGLTIGSAGQESLQFNTGPQTATDPHAHNFYVAPHIRIFSPQPSGTGSGMHPERMGLIGGGAGSVLWQPLDEQNPIPIAVSELMAALTAIVNYRTWLSVQRSTRKNFIDTLTTIAQIIDYDVTLGW